MKKGTKVSWTTTPTVRNPFANGNGVTISDEEAGHVLVAVLSDEGERHPVIWCATTWLKVTQPVTSVETKPTEPAKS